MEKLQCSGTSHGANNIGEEDIACQVCDPGRRLSLGLCVGHFVVYEEKERIWGEPLFGHLAA